MQTCLQSNCNLELASRIELGGGSFGAGERPSGFPSSEFSGSAGFQCFSLWVCVYVSVRPCVFIFVAEELVFIVVVVVT